MATLVKITLNGFVKRTQNTQILKESIRSTGATLSRKGRSRNWQLQADHNQIRKITTVIYQSEENSWLWLAKKIADEKPQLSQDELRVIVRKNPTISVGQIVFLTDCTLSDARKVLDEVEWE
ncbi:MAG: ribosome recycling factor family protein [Pseudomonadales bacterium]|nr:ribosome recycling factor family protein [Pseudomonadales bacterium]